MPAVSDREYNLRRVNLDAAHITFMHADYAWMKRRLSHKGSFYMVGQKTGVDMWMCYGVFKTLAWDRVRCEITPNGDREIEVWHEPTVVTRHSGAKYTVHNYYIGKTVCTLSHDELRDIFNTNPMRFSMELPFIPRTILYALQLTLDQYGTKKPLAEMLARLRV